MSITELPLFAWQPPACEILPFPMSKRTGKIRDVAAKLLAKSTERHADYYRKQVNESLAAGFERIGIAADEQERQIADFWQRVEAEMRRQMLFGHPDFPTGGAA